MAEEINNENRLSLKYQFKNKTNRLKFITRISMFSALAFVFYAWFKIPVALIFPGFLKLSISMVFLLIGAFSTGPLGAVLLCLVRFLLKIVICPADEMIGELIDLVLALIVTIPSTFFYMNHHDKKGGYIALLIAFISWIFGSVFVNFIFLDFYIGAFMCGEYEPLEIGISNFVNYLKTFIDIIDESNYKLIYCTLVTIPFNLLNGFINCGITALVYKKISVLLKKIGK